MLGLFLHRIKISDQAQGLVGAADLAFGLHLLGLHELATGVIPTSCMGQLIRADHLGITFGPTRWERGGGSISGGQELIDC